MTVDRGDEPTEADPPLEGSPSEIIDDLKAKHAAALREIERLVRVGDRAEDEVVRLSDQLRALVGGRSATRDEVRRELVVADARHPRDVDALTDAVVALLSRPATPTRDGVETNEQTMAAALAPFGWTCGPEFWQRYYSDPWVFNLANAVERLSRSAAGDDDHGVRLVHAPGCDGCLQVARVLAGKRSETGGGRQKRESTNG